MIRPRPFGNQSGQAAIETLVAGFVVVLSLGVGAHLLYVAFAQAWVTRAVREGAICLSTSEKKSTCRRRLQTTLDLGLPFGTTDIDSFYQRPHESHVEVSFQLDARFLRPLLTGHLADAVPTKFSATNSAPRF